MDMTGFWSFMSMLWNEAVGFMSKELPIFGFTLWEFALGSAVVGLVFYAIWRILE